MGTVAACRRRRSRASPQARRWSGLTGQAISLSKSLSASGEDERRVLAGASHIVTLKLVNQRLVTNYLDTRGVIAEYDAARDHYTLTLGSQGSHAIRDVIGVQILKTCARKDARHHS